MNAVTVRAAIILNQTSGFRTVMNLNREVFLDGFLITETHPHALRYQNMVNGLQVRYNGNRRVMGVLSDQSINTPIDLN